MLPNICGAESTIAAAIGSAIHPPAASDKGQEHSIECPGGARPERNHLPHRLMCRSSQGEIAEIIAIIKTQGSDTKLVAQMQPYYEARGLSRWDLAGRPVSLLVTQIDDG